MLLLLGLESSSGRQRARFSQNSLEFPAKLVFAMFIKILVGNVLEWKNASFYQLCFPRISAPKALQVVELSGESPSIF